MKKTNNNKKINKNLTVRRNIITISASFALMIVALLATIFVLNFKGYEKKFMAYDGYYDSQQVPDLIDTTGKPAPTYQKMSELYDPNSFARNTTAIGNYGYISIETKDDFYAFTRLCTTNDFKTKKFILLKDIDWSSTDQQRLVTPISSFAGELNGNGYTVKNLTLSPINQDKLSDNYALFKELAAGGKILNLGLVDTIMSINASPDSGKNIYLANLCAVNKGTIDHVYVKDHLDQKTKKTYDGMEVIISGFYISGVVAKNEGTFTNSYYAGKSIIKTNASLTITPNAIQEMLLENTGTQSNLYYYNESIESYTVNGSNISVKYSGVSQIYDYTSSSPRYGTYCKNLKDSSETEYGLGEEVTSFSGSNWINESYYEHSNFGALIDFTTPLYKKIDDSKVSLSEGIHTVEITSTEDFNYIFNQMLINDKFTDKSMVYQLECDINVDDMANISYDDSIQSKFTVAQSSEETPSYHTIYMSKYYNVFTTDTEYKAYGFFPYFAGELSYINFVLGNSSTAVVINDTDTTVKAIGSAIGYAEEAKIDHVNTYLNVSFDNAIGKYLAGGIVGVAAGRTTITNSTANGKITSTDSSRQNFSEAAKNVNGVAIGGCVGYIAKTGASVDTLLSNVEIKSQGYSGKEVTIGGVVAAGYFIDSTKLQNNGSITIAKGSNDTTAVVYSELYAGGVVGRFLGMYSEASFFTNNGDMTLYQAPSSPTYYAGILNADIQKTNVGSYVLQSKGINQFWAAAMTNGADIKIYSANTGTIMYTYGINLKNSNDFATKLSGIYNINYKFADPSTALGTINIDMNIIKTFAPVVMADNTSNATYAINMSTIYNLRNIEYKTSATVGSTTTFDYAGVVYADYVNYTNVRNEGNQTIILNNGISTASNLYVSGVFKSLSNNFKATSIYNGGDILISEPNGSNSQKIIDIYLSGICYQNASVDSDQKQNPLSTTFDKSLVGTLNNTINSGNISVNSYYYNDTTKNTKVNATPGTKPYLNSNIYVGGITNINNGIISNTFNLGDVNIPIYSYVAGKHYEAGGIAYVMNGEYAQIRDSANNGDITIIDTLIMTSKSYVNIGGIVARNTQTNSNNKEIISFTINYGTLFAFQPASNMNTPTAANAHATCGGIIGIGVCNLVNVLNYGTVYSNECAAGIVSVVNLKTFSSSNTINFANTINYGVVKINPLYYATDEQSLNYQTYNTITSMAYIENGDPSIKKTYSGAICTIFDFNSQNNINIRFLINLCNDATTIMTSLNSTTVDTSTFITSHGAADYFGNVLIKYAPLSTINDGNNIGVFNENFIFYKAINGEGLDTEHYVTDLYISDFFEFVKFDKINPILLDKIGWRTIAYANAAENLFKNVSALKTLVNLARTDYSNNGSGITDLLSDAFTSSTWIESMDIDLLNSLLEEVFKSGNTDGINTYKAVLKYLLLDSTANSSYTKQIRETVVNKIMEYYAEDANMNYYELLQTLLYDELLAKVVSSNNADYAEVLQSIRTTLEDCEDLSTIFDAYITELQTNSNLLNDLFTNNTTSSYYIDSKIALLQTLLSGYDQLTLEELYNKLTTGSLDSSVNYKLYLQENPNEAKNVYIGLITYNAFTDTLGASYLNWINEYTDKYNLTTVLNEEKSTDSTYSKMVDNFGNIEALSGYKYTALSGIQNDTNKQDSMTIASQIKTVQKFVANQEATSLNIPVTKDYSALWNVIKNNLAIQQYISNNYFEEITDPTSGIAYNGIYALATEWNNTYQSNDRSQLSYNIPITYHGGISVGGTSGNDYYGNSVFAKYDNVEINDLPIRNRYIYVPDEVVSYQTNYYGPFIAATGANKGVVYSADGHLIEGNANYNKGVAANNAIAVTTGSPKRNMIPVFIGLNSDFVVQKIAESNSNANNSNTYVFLWNDSASGTGGTQPNSDYMWKSISFISNKGQDKDPAKNSSGYIYYIYDGDNIASDPDNYIQYGYDFNPNRYTDSNKYITKANDAKNVLLPGGVTTPGINNTGYRHTYSEYYLRGYVTTSIITGVFMTHSTWPANNSNHISLHSKNETAYAFGDSNGYYGIHTTSYTYYTINDLVNLDGIRTKGHCINDANNLDEDEVNIISAICTKLLSTAAGRELVLYAIADYAKNNNFKSSDTAVVQMFLSAVQDTDFAKEIVTSGINEITNLKYSTTQTIGQYLDQYANNLSDYKDLIISKSVNNKINFRTVLLETLSNYAIKSKLYEDYYSYTRDAVTQYVYNYIKYRYDNGELDWTDFDSALQSVSDNDLTYLVDIFDASFTSVNLNNYTYHGSLVDFTIDDAVLYSSSYENYDDYDEYYDYDRVIVGKTNYNASTGGSYIEFTTDNTSSYGYDLRVTYDGTLNLVGNNQTITRSYTDTGEGATTTTFTGLASNTTYRLYFNQGTEIYDVVALLSSYHAGAGQVSSSQTYKSPFATYTNANIQNSNIDYNRGAYTESYEYGNYYYMPWRNGRNTESEIYVAIAKGTNVTYNSITVSFKTLSGNTTNNANLYLCYNANGAKTTKANSQNSITLTPTGGYATTTTNMFKYNSTNNNRQYVDNYVDSYSYTLPSSVCTFLENNNFTFTINSYKPLGYGDKTYELTDLIVTYDFSYTDDISHTTTRCVFEQNILSDYYYTAGKSSVERYSQYTIYNNNSSCGLVASSGTLTNVSYNFPNDNGKVSHSNNAYNKISAAITFVPWGIDADINQGDVFNDQLSINDISMNSNSIVNNLNSYYNLLSDVGKYIIKDYFVEQKNQNSISTGSINSYIEFYAKGNGQIKVYTFNDSHEHLSDYLSDTPYQTINVNSNDYQFYEILGNSEYVYLFTTLYTTDGSLYTYDSVNNEYNAVTSGAYNSSTHYYIKGKSGYTEVLVEDKLLFTTNGSLYTYDSNLDVYNAVTSGSYDSTATYYTFDGESYSVANVTDQNVLVDSVYLATLGGKILHQKNQSTGVDTVSYNINDAETKLLQFDYSTIASLNIINSHLADYNTDFGVNYDKYQLFYTIYPYYRYVAGYTNEELYNNDIFETLITLMATIKQDSTNTNYFTLFADSCFTDEKLIELIELIALADYNGTNSSLDKLISTTYFNDYCDDLLNYLCDETTGILEIKINAAKYIWTQANSNHSSALADYIYGAYLGNDYLSNANLKMESLMYTLLEHFNVDNKGDDYYQFILTNTTVDSNKVAELIMLLTSSSDFELGGYGIYALASTQGKENGQFIPDNLELDLLDPYYEVVSGVGYKLVSGTTSSSTWRGGIDDSSDPSKEDDVTDHSSVNYAFYKEMRQLLKSISTAVFELTLKDNATGDIEYYGDIDLDAKTVTFYLTEELTRTTYFKVSKIDLAYKAEAYDGPVSKYSEVGDEFDTSILISVTPADVTSHNASHQFTVFAEDTSVHKVYSIYFKVLKASFDLEYKDQTGDARYTKTVGSTTTNTTVELSLTSASANPSPSNYTDYLPIGLNLKPYIRLDKMDGTVVDTLYMDSDYIDLSTRSGDHIVKPVITNNVITGSKSTITMEISYKIPAGEYRITVSVCGYTAYVTYIKNANNLYTIEAHFGDSSANIFASSTTATSYVPFGRLYNNIELTDFDDDYDDETYGEFYLSYFSYSPNATVKCSATYLEVPVYDTLMVDGAATQVLLYNKYRYTITYVIEAEDIAIYSNHKRTYTHIVEELDPYSNGSQFGTVTKDGEEVDPGSPLYDQDAALDDNKVVSVKYQVGQLRTNNGDPVYKTEISKARVQFNRSDANGALNEPRYSISYNMDNIYTISPYATLTPVEITADTTVAGSATLKSRFGGMTIKMSYLTDTGVYEFKYVYNNKGVWYTLDENNDLTYENDVVVFEEYTSTYDFPAIQISKLFSLDATIHSITFMDAFQGTSAASTGVRIHAMRPTDDNLDTETGEMVYSDILDDTEGLYNDIAVQPNGDIVYNQKGTDYATVQYSDYYIVGAVSNAQLSNYAPTFTIEEHALIFQYITARISNNYGDGKQGELSDAAVLEDHSTTTYLYVPFTHVVAANDTQTIVNDVFLVQLNGKRLTNVYIAKGFTTSSTSIATINVTINDAKNTGASFTYDDVTYTLNKAVFGEETNNYSLYMDYIGSPLNDHFWYVNYVVFSENYVRGSESIYLKYYHIAIIDRSNNVYFDVLVIVPVDFDISKYDTLYLLFQGTYKDGSVNPAVYSDLAVGAYVYEPDDYDLNGVAKKAYVLRYNIQMLPSAYYYFNIDLPVGYQAEATVTNKTNFNAVDDYLGGNTGQMNYEGAYLPPSSIVAQVVKLTINVTEGATGETNVWGIQSSDVYTRRATLDNDKIVGN